MNNRNIEAENRRAAIEFGLAHGYIDLAPGDEHSSKIIVNKLITTLLYESNRHGWDSPSCQEIRHYVCLLNQKFNTQQKHYYESYIAHKETKHGTFYGSYLSDDSDSEEERAFHTKPTAEKTMLRASARGLIGKAQLDKISYKRKTKDFKKGDLKANGKCASEIFKLNKRHQIHPGQRVDVNKATRDLNRLNLLLSRNYSLEKAIAELTQEAQKNDEVFTTFYVAEYRGVTHLTTKWNKPSRKAHRSDKDEIGKPQYSASIYANSGISLFRDYSRSKQVLLAHPELFNDPAETLREILLTFREAKCYNYEKYSYSSLAYVFQNIYTQDFDEFHRLIQTDPLMKAILLNGANPFVSMGDTPYHAAKYAYGLKPYAGHRDDRIRPRWQGNGRAERPYSGVVYTSLHPISDFNNDGPLHLISLNWSAEIQLKNELNIIAERESCFPAYLPANRVVAKHIAKYPSFKEHYKAIFEHKYGLNPDLYHKFRMGLLSNKPHTQEHKNFKLLLGETLCGYYEVKMIDEARKIAEDRGGVLIYRDINNRFSFKPPIDSVNRHSNKITDAIKAPVKEKKKSRKAHQRDVNHITEIKNEKSSLSILDETSDDSEFDNNDALIKNKHEISIPLSLMLNAIKNKRYRALQHYLLSPMFRDAINEKFNYENLLGGTLLHLAVIENDITAINLLSNNPYCNLSAMADENTDISDKTSFYERITPLHYAVMLNKNESALLLLEKIGTQKITTCDYVKNKDLLSGDMLLTPEAGDDADYLGVAWYHREGVPIYRTRNQTILHIAIEFNNMDILKTLLSRKPALLEVKSMTLDSPLSLAILKKSPEAIKLLIEAGAEVAPHQKNDVELILDISPGLKVGMRP
jgi:ankyrin repeat protein